MSTHSPVSPTVRRLRLLAFPLAVAVVLTMLVIHESRFHGRLFGPPVYDDVAYMRDGVGRLIKLYQGGVTLLAQDLWKGPPRAPMQSAMAATGFAIFGMVEWAPYAVNGLVALLLLGLPAYIFRRSPRSHRVLLVLAMTALPVTLKAIHEFRPDITAAVLTAWGLALALDPPGTFGAVRRPLLIGLVFGLAMLAKTSTSPVTLALFGITVVMSGFMHAWPRNGRPETSPLRRPGELLWSALREGLVASAALLVVAGPYYARAWDLVTGYIYRNMFGDRADMWMVEGSGLFHLRYYLDGEGGRYMLGAAAYPALIAALAGVVVCLARGGARWRVGAAGLAAATLLAYGVSTWNPMKQQFLGLPFQLLMLLGGLLTLRAGLALVPDSVPGWRTLALAVLAAASLVGFRFPDSWSVQQPRFREARDLYDASYAAIREQIGRKPAVVLVTFTGMVNETNLEFRSHVDGAPFYGLSREEARSMEDYETVVEKAQLVLAAQSGTTMTNDKFPAGKFHDEMVERLETRGDFRRVWAWESVVPGREFRLYRRIKDAPRPAEAPPPQTGAPSPP